MRSLVLSLCLLSGTAWAEVSWRGDYETGDLSQWTEVEGRLSRLTLVSDPVRQGKYALRTELRAGDMASSGTRNELALTAEQFLEVEGNDKWYAWSTLFPAGYPSNNTWQVFTQWHHSGCCGSPPLEFDVLGETIQLAHNGDSVLWSAPLVRNVWHEFVVHVHWSARSGYIDLYYDGEKVLDRKAVQTLYPGEFAYLKQGLYRDASIAQVAVVYHDGMVVGTSLGDVAPHLVAPPPAPPPPVPAPPPPVPDAGNPDVPVDAGPGPDAGAPPDPEPVTPADPPVQASAAGYALPGGGCSHTTRDSLAVFGIVAAALAIWRRRR